MANCPFHTEKGVSEAMQRFEKLGCNELRSFNKNGTESGLMILKEDYLLKNHEISTHQSSIILESLEIHYKEDLEQCQEIFK